MSLSPGDARLFRERLAELRKGKSFTQASLSEAIGKGPKYIGQVETGAIGTPPLETIAEIAERLDVSISDLFFFEGKDDSVEQLRSKIQRLISTNDVAKLRRFYRILLVSVEN